MAPVALHPPMSSYAQSASFSTPTSSCTNEISEQKGNKDGHQLVSNIVHGSEEIR